MLISNLPLLVNFPVSYPGSRPGLGPPRPGTRGEEKRKKSKKSKQVGKEKVIFIGGTLDY